MKILNTFFKKRLGRRWTWLSPNGKHKKQIDYRLTPNKINEIKDFDVASKFEYHSDHRLLKCKIKLGRWRRIRSKN